MPKKITPSTNLYAQVVSVTHEYLGPAADRFVTRQLEAHLHKNPEEFRKRDLDKLIVWINLAMNLLIDDKALVAEYVAHLHALSNKSR